MNAHYIDVTKKPRAIIFREVLIVHVSLDTLVIEHTAQVCFTKLSKNSAVIIQLSLVWLVYTIVKL